MVGIMLNLYKLEIFYIASLRGSFSATAEHLYMTQSAVSQHIKELEASLGVKLFKRGRRGVALTTQGQTLFKYAERLLALSAEAENKVTNVSNLSEGKVTIGATPTIGVYLVPDWLQNFRKQYQNLTVSLTTATTDTIIRDIQSLKLELAFIEGEIKTTDYTDIQTLTLQTIEWYVVVAPNHPWWTHKSITINMLNQCGFVMRQKGSHTRKWVDNLFNDHSIIPKITAEFDNPESIKQALHSGDNVTILPQHTLQREIESKQLRLLTIQDVEINRNLKLVWNKKRPFSPIGHAFIKFMNTHYPVIEQIML
jgi:LysR family transcriptional regulator, transcriptional activator of the cysJI operon